MVLLSLSFSRCFLFTIQLSCCFLYSFFSCYAIPFVANKDEFTSDFLVEVHILYYFFAILQFAWSSGNSDPRCPSVGAAR